MEKGSRIEDKKRYNAPYLKAFDYLAREMFMNQKQLAAHIKGESPYISALRSGVKRVGDDYIARLAIAFKDYFKENGHLNIDYILGKSQYMLIENIPHDELENEALRRNPDYEVIRQREKECNKPQPVIPTADVSVVWIENAVKAATRYADMEIATLKEQIEEKNKYIDLLEKRVEELDAANKFLSETHFEEKWPFPRGVADERKKKIDAHV